MTPEEYQRRRAQASLGMLGALRPLARLLRPRPSPAEWQSWVQAAYPAVYRSRVEHWQIAQQFYVEERNRFGATDPVTVPLRNYSPEALDTGLTEMVKPRLDALDEDDPVPTVIIDETLEVADRHATDAGREAIVDAARHDQRALGYARTTVGMENCSFCLLLVSRGPVYKSEDTALLRDGTGEPYHDRCVPAGTVVHGPSVDVAYRRLYEGELLVVETAGGHKLSITPNHPVLTDQGWVPADRLSEGSYVVSGLRANGLPAGVPHEHHGESLIEDVWGSLGMGAPTGVPGSTEDFHGDGSQGQVDVVFADSFLRSRREASFLEPRLHQYLTWAGRLRTAFPRLCLFHQAFLGGRDAARGRVGSLGLPKSVLGRHGSGSLLSRVAVATDAYSSFLQSATDGRARHAVLARESQFGGSGFVALDDVFHGQGQTVTSRFDPTGSYGSTEGRLAYVSQGGRLRERLSGGVQLDRVVHLRRVGFSGHVYNLRTSEGWYSADGVIVSNCDCIAVPVFDRDDWPGRDEYLEMEAAWQEHGGDLQSWRRYIDSLEQSAEGDDQAATAA